MNEKANELLNKIRFGNQDEKFQGLVALGGEKLDIGLEEISPILYSIMEKSEDPNDTIYAAIALARQGEKSERLKDWLLNVLLDFSKDHEICTPLGLLESQITKGLSMFKGNKKVSDGLIEAIQNCSTTDSSKLMIKPTMRAIGAIGHDSALDFLKYWRSKGNVSAMVAIDSFGSTWREIFDKEKTHKEYSFLVEEEVKVLETLENQFNVKFHLNSNFKEENNRVIFLNLAGCKLETVPNNIGKLISLKKLFLYDNNLTDLPTSIGDLNKLEELSLSNNNIVELPESIGKLNNLKSLKIAENKIKEIPLFLLELPNLEELSVEGNPLKGKTKKILKLMEEKGIKVK